MGWRIDVSRFPIVVHETVGKLSDVEVDAYVAQATTTLLGYPGQRQVIILDSTRVGTVSPYMRQQARDWQKRHAADLKERCHCVIYVLATPLLRFIAMTVKTISRPAVEYLVCATLEEATREAERRLG